MRGSIRYATMVRTCSFSLYASSRGKRFKVILGVCVSLLISYSCEGGLCDGDVFASQELVGELLLVDRGTDIAEHDG